MCLCVGILEFKRKKIPGSSTFEISNILLVPNNSSCYIEVNKNTTNTFHIYVLCLEIKMYKYDTKIWTV